jgi:hypothetical protein
MKDDDHFIDLSRLIWDTDKHMPAHGFMSQNVFSLLYSSAEYNISLVD